MKFPYHARQSGIVSGGVNQLHEPLAFYCQPDRLFIGNGDLSIDFSFSSGTSELENTYGIGLDIGSKVAMCALAGSPVFPIHEFEAWSVL